MQAEHLGRSHDGQAAQVGQELVLGARVRAVEEAARGELVVRALFDDLLADEHLNDAVDQHLVLLVGDAAAIVDLRPQELEDLVRDLRVVVQEIFQLPAVGRQVLRREVVRDVPADGSELAPVLADRVEETEAVHEACIRFGLLAIRQHAVVYFHHRAKDVGPQALRRLVRHLDAVLQEQGGELLGWHGRQPEPIRVVRLLRVHLLANPLQLGQPAHGQVAIAEQYPAAALPGPFDHAGGLRALALPERDAFQLVRHALRIRELHHVVHRVAARRKDKNERRHLGGILVRDGDVEDRRLHEFLPHFLRDEGDHRGGQPVRPERPQEAHALHRRQALLPIRGQFALVGLGHVVDGLEGGQALSEGRVEAVERRQVRQREDLIPTLR
mmetsp:Transcript_59669/g.172846  ORF Transcript_59669/g.172846 Transcript_59669/m.172846 type:complete len:385 (+) Transcript_59669:1071-2225(+)